MLGDSDSLFDHQASVLLARAQRPSSHSNQISASSLIPSSSSLVETVTRRVTALEERINACDSIYRLAAQTNASREKERRNRHTTAVRRARESDNRVISLEDQMSQVPQFIKETIREEVSKRNKFEQFRTQIQTAADDLFGRLSALESQFVETTRKTQKVIRKVNAEIRLCKAAATEDAEVEDISLQIDELRRRQQVLLELLNAIRSQNDQDFDGVNSQLAELWTQLSAKRSEGPYRRTIQ
jgi:chromosome segregation ATPase